MIAQVDLDRAVAVGLGLAAEIAFPLLVTIVPGRCVDALVHHLALDQLEQTIGATTDVAFIGKRQPGAQRCAQHGVVCRAVERGFRPDELDLCHGVRRISVGDGSSDSIAERAA